MTVTKMHAQNQDFLLKMAIAFMYIDYKVNLVKNGDYILRYKHIALLSSKLCILIRTRHRRD